MDNNGLNSVALIDEEQFQKSVNNVKDGLESLATQLKSLNKESNSLGSSFKKTFTKLGIDVSAEQLKKFATEVVRVRGEFQSLEVSMTALLGSKSKANQVMDDVIKMAALMPFNMEDVASGATRLLSFGAEAEGVMETLTRLGDVAAGLSIPFTDLVSLYGDVLSQGQLTAGGLEQFTAMGIPMINELASQFGVAKTEVQSLVEQGKVGFPEVQAVIESLTNTGGRFHNVMGEQSKTLKGQVTALQNAWTSMLNGIGQETEGVASLAIGGATSILESYEAVGKILMALIATYGVTRAAILAYDVIKARDIALDYAKLAVTGQINAAMKVLNLTMLKNPIIAAIAAVTALVTIMLALRDTTTSAERAQAKYNDQRELAAKREQEHKQRIDGLISTIEDSTAAEMNRVGALEDLKAAYPSIIQKYIDEEGRLRNIMGLKKEIADFDARVGMLIREKQFDRTEEETSKLKKELEHRKNRKEGEKGYLHQEYRGVPTSTIQKKYDDNVNLQKLQKVDVNKDIINRFTSRIGKMSDQAIENGVELVESMLSKLKDGEKGNLKLSGKIVELDTTQLSSLSSNLKFEQEKRENKDKNKDSNKGNESINPKNTQDDALDIERKRADDLIQMQLKNRQEEIDLNSNTAEKKREQIQLDYDKEYQLILNEEKRLRNAQNGQLTPEQSEEINKSYSNADKRKTIGLSNIDKQEAEDQKNEYTRQLSEYEAFANKYLSTVAGFEKNLKNLKEKGESKEDIEVVRKTQEETINALDEEFALRSEDFTSLLQKVTDMGIQELYNNLEEAKAALEAAKDTGGDKSKDVAKYQSKINVLQEQILSYASREEDKVSKGNSDKWGKSISLMKNVRSTISDVIDEFDGLDDSTKNILKSSMDIASGTLQMISSISDLGQFSMVATEQTAEGTSKSVQSVEKASAILAIISMAIKIISAIVNIAKGFFNNDKAHEKNIQDLQEKIDVLEASYDKLGKSIDKAYSSDASNLIKQQNTLLEQQKVLIQQQINEEKSKKKSDPKKIEEYQKQIEDINNTIADNKVKAQDAIFGADVKSAIEEFAQAYADAWAAGESKADSMKNVVKQMIKGVIVEMLKSDFAPTVQKIRDRIEDMLKNGISPTEQAELDKMIEDMVAKSDRKYSWADKYMKEDKDLESDTQESSKGAFATMSQDTGDELNGRFTALQMSGEEIKSQSILQTTLFAGMSVNMDIVRQYTQGISLNVSEMRDIALTSMNHLAIIEKNTKHLQFMREDLAKIKDKVNYL